MRYVRYRSASGALGSGVLVGDEIAALDAPLQALLASGGKALDEAGRRAVTGGARVAASSVALLPPVAPSTVVAPGPRIVKASRDLSAFREFYLKSSHTIQGATQAVPYRDAFGTISYRAQVGVVTEPGTGRWTAGTGLRDRILGVVLVAELMSVELLRVGWEGTMWHTRFGEGASFDGATLSGPWLATGDDARLDGITLSDAWGEARVDPAAVEEELSYVARWMALGPELLVLAGSPHGPVLRLEGADPVIEFDGREPRLGPGGSVRASGTGLGEIDAAITPDTATVRS